MINIPVMPIGLYKGAAIISMDVEKTVIVLPKTGGGLSLPEIIYSTERYLVFDATPLTDHSVVMNLFVYVKDGGADKPVFDIRFGLLPKIPVTVCIDLDWLNADILFPEHPEGQLKFVCHGGRNSRSDAKIVSLENNPCFKDIQIEIKNLRLTDTEPERMPLPDEKLIDKFGQWTRKSWQGKMYESDDLRRGLESALNEPDEFVSDKWDIYGGNKEQKLSGGTGFFTKIKTDGRWRLVDPLGNAFFSLGLDCVRSRTDCRIDGAENMLEWLPQQDDAEYGGFFYGGDFREYAGRRKYKGFSFTEANLYRAFGKSWREKWRTMIGVQLKRNGFNTIANWSDPELFGAANLAYVMMPRKFPTTETKIFRDFPDVLSDEYRRSAEECARELEKRRDDPFMIGYFLRNEPSWAFVDNLVIADEVLYNAAPTVCKDKLVKYIEEKYININALNTAWNTSFSDFNDLRKPLQNTSKLSADALADMRAFSKIMLEAYVSIPSEACRRADPNHMNLGMRWAWISDPDIITGWENFDVFSINCYANDPYSAIENVKMLGVDLPVMIGEFHFGALDAGLTATGLEAVETQEDRGIAYRYYCERAAAHPYGVGAHYFQCYDQFALGRFDGENYNIGIFDICSRPYEDMTFYTKECARHIYDVSDNIIPPFAKEAKRIPMIAY